MISTSEGVQASKTRANRKLSRVSGESMVTERVIFFNSEFRLESTVFNNLCIIHVHVVGL